ncbi:MAG: hypothetical protein Q8M29_08790 [Bacteroidota bacterium]|nr:hypothetical protein [Bacteroidota bacterium]
MKKLKLNLAAIIFPLLSISSFAQSNWELGGNDGFPPNAVNATNNTLGTLNNLPIKFATNNTQRMFISASTPGLHTRVGIGSLFSNGIQPFASLHIQSDNTFGAGGGTRPWMQPTPTLPNPGLLIGNEDNIWLGLRNKGGNDLNDAVLNWGDNGGSTAPVSDYFRFTFTHYGSTFLGSNNDGLEIMRLAPNSFVGIGDYNINGILQPQSKLHIHENTSLHTGGTTQSVWMQMTNNDFAPSPTANDGLRIGLLYQNANQRTGNAFIYNQENRHLIFSTNHAVPDGTGSINNTQERMRITSIGSPTTLAGGGYGVFNPAATANTDFTRVAISLNPFNPIYRPLSLLHLGYQASGSGTNLDGWRPWMDIGTFTNNDIGGSMYSGLRSAATNDAVISWGYTPTTGGPLATRMRVIFTTTTNTTTVAGSTNGIEAAHFWSDGNNARMGVGDMMTANVDPQNTLEIRSSANSPYNATANASGL